MSMLSWTSDQGANSRLSEFRTLAILVVLFWSSVASADPMSVEESAKAFGTMPGVYGASLSPDGQRVGFLTHSAQHDLPIAMSIDLETRKSSVVAASDPKKADVRWCKWANDSRLLCGFFGIKAGRGKLFGATRLVAANYDGSGIKVLAQKQQRDIVSLDQAEIVDWLPDDRDHILMEIQDRYDEANGFLSGEAPQSAAQDSQCD